MFPRTLLLRFSSFSPPFGSIRCSQIRVVLIGFHSRVFVYQVVANACENGFEIAYVVPSPNNPTRKPFCSQFYYVFGFLLLVFIILIITCAEITVVMCYFQLCAEDYHWWWRAFLTSGSSAGYMSASHPRTLVGRRSCIASV